MATQLVEPTDQQDLSLSRGGFLGRLLVGGALGAGAGIVAGGLGLESLAWGILAGFAGAAAGVFGVALQLDGEPAEEWDR